MNDEAEYFRDLAKYYRGLSLHLLDLVKISYMEGYFEEFIDQDDDIVWQNSTAKQQIDGVRKDIESDKKKEGL